MKATGLDRGAAFVAGLFLVLVGVSGCNSNDDRVESSNGGPVLRTPSVGKYYPEAGVVGELRLARNCLSLANHGRLSVPVWPPSTTWNAAEQTVSMENNGYSASYKVGSRILDAGGGYYADLKSVPSLVGKRVWAQAVNCTEKLGAEQIVIIAPPTS